MKCLWFLRTAGYEVCGPLYYGEEFLIVNEMYNIKLMYCGIGCRLDVYLHTYMQYIHALDSNNRVSNVTGILRGRCVWLRSLKTVMCNIIHLVKHSTSCVLDAVLHLIIR